MVGRAPRAVTVCTTSAGVRSPSDHVLWAWQSSADQVIRSVTGIRSAWRNTKRIRGVARSGARRAWHRNGSGRHLRVRWTLLRRGARRWKAGARRHALRVRPEAARVRREGERRVFLALASRLGAGDEEVGVDERTRTERVGEQTVGAIDATRHNRARARPIR